MNILEINNVKKKYWNNEVLKGINFEVNSWDFFALLWHNGAWKTTLISILTNLVNKSSGQIKVNWIDIDVNFPEARKNIWVVPQEFNFDIFAKVRDIVIQQAGFYGVEKEVAKKRADYYLDKLGLADKKYAKARELSGWMKRRLMIARALVHEPKILILDEPTAGVDVELRTSMWKFIKELNASGTTIILTTHYLEEVEALCNKVVIINKWEVVENTTTKKLLSWLSEEIIILNTKQWRINIPDVLVSQYQAKHLDEHELEVTISKQHSLNSLFELLNTNNIELTSFRNKTNRLEALFMKITQ